MQKRRSFGGRFKAKVVLKVLTDIKSTSQVCREHGIKETLLSRWKQEFMERSTERLERQRGRNAQDERVVAPLELVKLVKLNIRQRPSTRICCTYRHYLPN